MRPPTQMTTSTTNNDGQTSLKGHQQQHNNNIHNNNNDKNNKQKIITNENQRTILNSESDGRIFYNQYKNDLNINSTNIKRSETTNCGKIINKTNCENNFIGDKQLNNKIIRKRITNDESFSGRNFGDVKIDDYDDDDDISDDNIIDDDQYFILNDKKLKKSLTNHDNFINHLTENLIIKKSNTNNLLNNDDDDNDKLKCIYCNDNNKQKSSTNIINTNHYHQDNNFLIKKISSSNDVPKNLFVNRLYDLESSETSALLNKCCDQHQLDQVKLRNKKKEEIPVVHRRQNKTRKSEEIRRSLQWPIGCEDKDLLLSSSSTATTPSIGVRRNQFHSWYASGYDTLIEELEQDIKDNSSFHTLAGARSLNINGTRESASLLEQPQNNQIRTRRSIVCLTSQQNEGPHAPSLGGPAPSRKRFGQFLKSLVGRKTSKDTTSTTTPLTSTTTTQLLHTPELIYSSDTPSINSLTNLTQSRQTIGNSTTSLNLVHQKLWSVVPLLRKETSCSSLHQTKFNSIVYETHLRKCNTVLALTQTTSTSNYLEPIKPLNRLRNYASIATCSRCSSLLSLAASSRYSLNLSNGGFVTVGTNNCLQKQQQQQQIATFICKLCLGEIKFDNSTNISQCGCLFCSECMTAYVEFEILEGAYEISCPDAMCPSQGILTLAEIMLLASPSLVEKHRRYRLNREVELDINRTWCPKAGCETVCLVGPTTSEKVVTLPISPTSHQAPCSVHCPTCEEDFCSGCKKTWHPTMSCEENLRRLAADGHDDSAGIPFDSDLIKCCPMCSVPIEKDEGCAQMMCKRCKHVFCWYCLASLDDDFLLRHYDKGPCKNKLGHSRASVVWHRAQVIGIFAGFGILLLVASPLLLLAAPCIVCCKCRICSGTAKLEETDNDFDDVIALQRN